jgi:D-alanyl-D-alanine carboxypeptidase
MVTRGRCGPRMGVAATTVVALVLAGCSGAGAPAAIDEPTPSPARVASPGAALSAAPSATRLTPSAMTSVTASLSTPGDPSPAASAGPSVVASPTPGAAATAGESPSMAASVGPDESAFASPGASGSPAIDLGDLPACRYADMPVREDPGTQWATVLLDTAYTLSSDFAPRSLVNTAKAGIDGGDVVIPAVIDDLRALHDASVKAGAEVAVRGAYRSYADQELVFADWVKKVGKKAARQYSARPGHSEHQLGTAIDFRSADSLQPPWDYPDWGATPAGIWMAANAWQYGFIESYPKDMQVETCYAHEPWHYRYVGRDVAKAVHESGKTLRRFLWDQQKGDFPPP